EHIDGADDLAVGVAQRRRIRDEWHTAAVRSLGDRLGISYRPPFPERDCHGALVVPHWSAVGPVQLPGDAPFVATEPGLSPGQFDRRFIVISDLAFRIGGVDRRRDRGQQFLQPLFAPPQRGFGPLTLRNIPRDFRGANDIARRVAYRRHGERNVDQASILALADGFVVIHLLAAADAREDAGFFVETIWRNENGHRLADHLRGGIAE